MRKIASLFLTIVMVVSFAACDFENLDLTLDGNTLFGDTSSNYEEDSDQSKTPTFYNLEDLRDYLNEKKDKDIFNVSFYYKGTEELDPLMLAPMVSCFYMSYKKVGLDNLHEIKISEYPGDRMADAYFNRNNVTLNDDEQKALDKATEMLASIKSKAKDDWELELAIHDALADHVTYYDEAYDKIDPESPPRFLTAVGALLDGKANCQGYTDAFYLVATLAGFEVSRMNVDASDGPHVVNTINLKGNWYVVDVTFDDQGDGVKPSYRMFNAGLDQTGDLFWEPYKEIHKISEVSGMDSYYIRKGLVFDDVDLLAQRLTDMWLAGERTLRCMLKNQTDAKVLSERFGKYLNNTGKSVSYKIWSNDDGKNLYCTIEIE